jgi:hypothetical protein
MTMWITHTTRIYAAILWAGSIPNLHPHYLVAAHLSSVDTHLVQYSLPPQYRDTARFVPTSGLMDPQEK